jgi:cytochrome c biogenesis protein CcmG/thiol:disulfide interchange protein DsbE
MIGYRFIPLMILFSAVIFSGSSNTHDYYFANNKITNEFSGERKIAPEFVLYTFDGNNLKMSDYRGKIVILDFWATWCPPCRKGIPDLIELQNEFKEDLVIIGISLDQPSTIGSLKSFIQEYGINYSIVFGTMEVAMAYGNIQAIPTSFVVNRDGEIVEKFVGLVPKSNYINLIGNLID